MSVLILAFSRILKMEFVILNFPMNKNNGFYDTTFLVKKKIGKVFVGVTSVKPSRDFTRLLGMRSRLKRLVAYAKCNRLSHERGISVGISFCFILFSVLHC